LLEIKRLILPLITIIYQGLVMKIVHAFLSVMVFCASGNLIFAGTAVDRYPALPARNGSVILPAQKFPYHKGERTIKVYLYYPKGKLSEVNSTTGLFLTLHNWGGKNATGAPSPKILSIRYNTICIAVDYLQSGSRTVEPYDYGYLQSLDALRALHYVWGALDAKGINFSKRRIYCCGGSGGGNVSQMANKFAPRTFACVVDLSGMASLTDDIAYNLLGGSKLNARYSKDPANLAYLEKQMQEIRDIGNPTHLEVMKKMGNIAKIIVIHGVDDTSCLASDKKRAVENMKAAGLDVEPHFIEKKDVDGKLIANSGHSIGNRTNLLIKYADKYLSEKSEDMKKNTKADFEFKNEKIKYETSNGDYLISYKNGFPVSEFVPKAGYTPKERGPVIPQHTMKSYRVADQAFPWYDRTQWVIVNLPESLAGETVVKQSCSKRDLVLSKKVSAVTIGVFEKDLAGVLKNIPEMKDANMEFGLQNPKGGAILKYKVVVFPNPELVNNWAESVKFSAGIVLLKMNAIEVNSE
ncbi:MAG: DUF2920 family protein, partial [Victivallaceae bacterium]|nr:DUF2920 family protein [Victivallaceae bacterium]